MHDLMEANIILIKLLSEVDQEKKLTDIRYCCSIPDFFRVTESILVKNENLSKDQIDHINHCTTLYTMAINIWLATIFEQHNWEEALKFSMKGELKDYTNGLELMVDRFQKLSELVDLTFPYLPQEDPFGWFLNNNGSSDWNKFSLFGQIVAKQFMILVSECNESYFEFSRKKTLAELKEILDSGILKSSKKQQFDFKDFKMYKSIEQCNNLYLALVIVTAYRNKHLQSILKIFFDTYESGLELAEKIHKRTKVGKTSEKISSYAWVKGSKKYGTSKGGYYK